MAATERWPLVQVRLYILFNDEPGSKGGGKSTGDRERGAGSGILKGAGKAQRGGGY